jgi:lipoprotein-anchoring transpeptidase ErfK/SrfK
MRKPILKLMTALMALTLLADMSSFADAKHRYKRHHVHHHVKKYVKHKKRRAPALPPIVVANIDVSSQVMNVSVNGWSYGTWKVSTARAGYSTPRGRFGVQRMARTYFSKKYDNSPMPFSVFFSGGNAIHGTGHLAQLGRPASHGCVRLAPSNAAAFFGLVAQYGPKRTRISITE